MGETNYGINLQKCATITGTYVDVGKILDLNLPEFSTDKVEKTNHASGGKRQYTPSGLMGMADFDVTLQTSQALLSGTYNDMSAGTISYYKVVYPAGLTQNDWVFQAFPTKIAPSNADAQSPDIMKVVVTYSPSAGLSTGL